MIIKAKGIVIRFQFLRRERTEQALPLGRSTEARPYMNTNVAGNIAIEWAESGAIVSFTKNISKTILANFNGESTYGSGETAVTLPKITLPKNGYNVEITANETQPVLWS